LVVPLLPRERLQRHFVPNGLKHTFHRRGQHRRLKPPLATPTHSLRHRQMQRSHGRRDQPPGLPAERASVCSRVLLAYCDTIKDGVACFLKLLRHTFCGRIATTNNFIDAQKMWEISWSFLWYTY
jgi:hypothetical protein